MGAAGWAPGRLGARTFGLRDDWAPGLLGAGRLGAGTVGRWKIFCRLKQLFIGIFCRLGRVMDSLSLIVIGLRLRNSQLLFEFVILIEIPYIV